MFVPIPLGFNAICRWIQQVPREQWIVSSGLLVLLIAARDPWYHIPPSILQAFDISLAHVSGLKSLMLAAAFLGIVAFWIGRHQVSRFLLWQALVVVLLTPYVLTTWTPALGAVTANLYEQNQHITAHVEHTLPTVQGQWKQTITLMPDRTSASTFGLTIPDSRFFQPAAWDYLLLEGLGYRNSTLAFIGKGWMLSLIGLILTLLGTYTKSPAGVNVLEDLRWLFPQLTAVIGCIFLTVLGINLLNFQLEHWLITGAYSRIAMVSQIAQSCYPALKQDENFQIRLAHATTYSGVSNPFLIALVKGLEQYRWGEYGVALGYFRQALQHNPTSILARKYVAIAQINAAVDYYETPILPNRPSGRSFPSRANFMDSHNARQGPIRAKPAGAIAELEQVLDIFPDHLGVLYNLMLAHSINGDFAQTAAAAQRLIELQGYFQQPNMALLGQAYTHLAWKDYHADQLGEAWKRHRQSVDPRRW